VVGRDRRLRDGVDHSRVWEPWAQVAQAQAGVVGRAQLLALGLTPGQIGALLDARRWTGLLPGVYATFTGPVPATARAWAAVLYAGRGAALGGSTALWLCQVLDAPPHVMTVCVPAARTVEPQPGLRVVRTRGLERVTHPASVPRRLRVEAAVLDVAHEAPDDARAVDVVLRATQQRRTTPDRLSDALAARARHSRRALLRDLLAEVVEGVQSQLERRWRSSVELRHGLPRAERNVTERANGPGAGPRNRYRDVRYRRWGLVVELDGAEAHPTWLKFRERRRDNALVVAGEPTLRYGWRETVGDPCGIAVEVAVVLRRLGWAGSPRPCGPGCPVADLG